MKQKKKKFSPKVLISIVLALASAIMITIIAYHVQNRVSDTELSSYIDIAEEVLQGKSFDNLTTISISKHDNYVVVGSQNLFTRGQIKASISDSGDLTATIDYEETQRLIGSIILGIIAALITLLLMLNYYEKERISRN